MLGNLEDSFLGAEKSVIDLKERYLECFKLHFLIMKTITSYFQSGENV